MYSDMPIEEMAKDSDFPKKVDVRNGLYAKKRITFCIRFTRLTGRLPK